MANVKITGMAADASVGGAELLAVSDAGSPKSVTVDNLKDYIVDAIEAIAALGSVDGNDFVLMLENGDTLKPTDIDKVAQHAIDTVWGKAAEATPDGADVLALKDGGTTEKTLLLSVLATYIQTTIAADLLDISSLSAHTPIVDTDEMLIVSGSTAKKIDFSDLSDAVLGAFDDYLAALGTVSSTNDTDLFYCTQTGTEKKVPLSDILTHNGTLAKAPASTTENKIPQWNATNSLLKDGLTLDDATFTTGDADHLASTTAIRGEMNTIINDSTDIGAAIVDADTVLIDDGAAGTTQRKSAVSRLWTYITGKIQGLSAKTTPVDADILTIQDSADSNALKELTLANFATYLDTDTNYGTKWIPAIDMQDSNSNPATTGTHDTGNGDIAYRAFTEVGNDTHAIFSFPIPEDWDLTTLKAKVYWTYAPAGTATRVVRFYLAAISFADDVDMSSGFGTAVNMDDHATAVNDAHITAASTVITPALTPALGDMVYFRLSRDYDYNDGSGALDEEALVLGVLFQYKKTVDPVAW